MTEPVRIEERDALALHDRLLALHGGAAGVRDTALLQSALARPRQISAYAQTPGIIDMAAGTLDEQGYAAFLRANASFL